MSISPSNQRRNRPVQIVTRAEGNQEYSVLTGATVTTTVDEPPLQAFSCMSNDTFYFHGPSLASKMDAQSRPHCLGPQSWSPLVKPRGWELHTILGTHSTTPPQNP